MADAVATPRAYAAVTAQNKVSEHRWHVPYSEQRPTGLLMKAAVERFGEGCPG
jgi:hypothetical protein